MLFIAIFFILLEGIIIYMVFNKATKIKRELLNQYEINNKDNRIHQLIECWQDRKIKGWSIEKYLKDNNYNQVAVYGIGKLGELLIEELSKTDIDVKYGIDKNPMIKYKNLVMYNSFNELPKVDTIIVTAVYYYWDIKENLDESTIKVISLEDIIYE